jgi:hypothetical protein
MRRQTTRTTKPHPAGFLEALEAGATLADGSQDVEQVARRPGQPIKTRHYQHVIRIEVVEHLGRGHKLCASGGVEPGACHDRFLAAS